jgi:hypothetical protein
LSEDPIWLAGGINLYTFAGNDPVNSRDPSGLDEGCELWAWYQWEEKNGRRVILRIYDMWWFCPGGGGGSSPGNGAGDAGVLGRDFGVCRVPTAAGVLAVDASIADRVVLFIEQSLSFSPVRIGPYSAFRSSAIQWLGYQLNPSLWGESWKSAHEAGFAVDINNYSSMSRTAQAGVVAAATANGFVQSLLYRNEPWHFFAGSYGPFGSRAAAIEFNQRRLAAYGGNVRDLPMCR